MKPARTDPAGNLKAWMRRRFESGWARGWDSTLRIELAGVSPFYADFLDNSMRLISCRGARPPLAVLHSDTDSLQQILRGVLPLELAVMTNRLSTDNMTEIFKFVTVFKPDPHTVAIVPAQDPDAAPKKRLQNQNPQFLKDFFAEWGRRSACDMAVSNYSIEMPAAARLAFETRDPRMVLVFKSGKKGITVTIPSKTSKVHFSMPFSALHAILTGAQNLMIDLNFKQIAPVDFTENERKLLKNLIQLQPLMSKSYRKLHAQEGLNL